MLFEDIYYNRNVLGGLDFNNIVFKYVYIIRENYKNIKFYKYTFLCMKNFAFFTFTLNLSQKKLISISLKCLLKPYEIKL